MKKKQPRVAFRKVKDGWRWTAWAGSRKVGNGLQGYSRKKDALIGAADTMLALMTYFKIVPR